MSRTVNTLTIGETQKLLSLLRTPTLSSPNRIHCLRNYTMVVLMLDTGIRVGELVQLKIQDLIFNNEPINALVIRADIAKNKVERIVPLTILTKGTIAEMTPKYGWHTEHRQKDWAFDSGHWATHITTRQVQRIIKTAGLQSIGRKITPHTLRHTFASRLMRTTNVRIVQELLGHKNITTTQIYTHPNGDDLTKAIQSLES